MHRTILAVAAAGGFVLSALPANAVPFSASLSGFEEIGPLNNKTGAILTDGQASLQIDLNVATQTLTYSLTCSGLSSSVTQAHIHL